MTEKLIEAGVGLASDLAEKGLGKFGKLLFQDLP